MASSFGTSSTIVGDLAGTEIGTIRAMVADGDGFAQSLRSTLCIPQNSQDSSCCRRRNCANAMSRQT